MAKPRAAKPRQPKTVAPPAEPDPDAAAQESFEESAEQAPGDEGDHQAGTDDGNQDDGQNEQQPEEPTPPAPRNRRQDARTQPPAGTATAPAPLTPGGSPEAARQAAPSDFVKAKIPEKYGSSTIYGRGGKETVHRGGEVVEMTRAQAERIGATIQKPGSKKPADTSEEE